MIDGIIYDKETVVGLAIGLDFYRGILMIMAFEVLLQCAADGRRKYEGRNPWRSLGKLTEHRVVDVIVDHDNTPPGTSNQITHQGIGIEYLTLKKDPLPGWKSSTNEEIHSVAQLLYLTVMLREPMVKPSFHVE